MQGGAPGLGGGNRLRHHGGDALADEAGGAVQQQGVVGVGPVVLVPGGGIPAARRVLMRQHRHHPWHRQRRRAVDGTDAGMGVRGAQQAQVQQARHADVERVARRARHHICRCRGRGVHHCPAINRIGDSAVAGAAAQVALHGPGQVGPLRLVQRMDRHHHARGAEPALEALRLGEAALCRVHLRPAQPLYRRDLAVRRAEGRHQAAMHRHPVQQHGAGAAIAGAASLLDAEPAELP